MKYIVDVEDQLNLRALIQQDLKELGVKCPKNKKNKTGKQDDSLATDPNCFVFGNHLCHVPSEEVEGFGPVPRFLVDATELLERHLQMEGLFRKSGSVTRQKELKQRIEEGEELPTDAHPFDVASLIKQFLRELPDPLLTSRLHDTYVRCLSLESEQTRFTCTMLVTLLLPWEHLSTLKYLVMFLQLVADHSDHNKMDVANLAVCLAPNLLYSSTARLDNKASASESKVLQLETSVVEMLIEYADQVGVVSDSLYQRTSLMGSCFASDEEMERSDMMGHPHDDSKNRKKKKRSGSLQGLVSNLSSSFTKWRKDGKGHNSSSMSDKSALSYSSIDKSSIVIIRQNDQTDSVCDYIDPLCPEATPKIRKRKAEEDMVPFSASKKKAILQNMPQMSTLAGTPFTPMTKKGRPPEYVDTPSIQFADNADMVFHAHTPRLNTPRNKKLFSPVSSTKVKRSATIHGHASAKSGCFSPKTPKGGVRRSVKGFFRRLSGGKDAQPSPSSGQMNSSDVGMRLSSRHRLPEHLIIMQPGSRKKGGGLFRRHRKAPSSPARLITPGRSITSSLQRGNYLKPGRPVDTSSIKSPQQEEADEDDEDDDDCAINESLTNEELAARLQDDLQFQSPPDEDARCNVTVPRIRKRGYSADGAPVGCTSLVRGRPNSVTSGLPSPYHRRSMDTDTIEAETGAGAKKETFQSPEKPDMLECMPGAFDTSPIPRALDADLEAEEEEDEEDDEEEDEVMEMEAGGPCHGLTHHVSATSVMSVGMESEHDQAFVEESLLCADGADLLDHLDRPLRPVLTSSRNPSRTQLAEDEDEDEVYDDEDMDTPSTSALTVIDAGSRQTSCGSLVARQQTSRSGLQHQSSVDSVDSALDSESPGVVLSKAASTHSIYSCDSGVNMEGQQVTPSDTPTTTMMTPEQCSGQPSTETSVESQQSVPLHRQASTSSQISAETPAPASTAATVKVTPPVALAETEESKMVRESVLNLQEAKKVSSLKGRELSEDVAERHRSALRFPNSTMRRRAGASPVRIPTIFAKADGEAARYRQMVNVATRGATGTERSRPAGRRPNLPISTQLVRSRSVERACLQHGCTDGRGAAPQPADHGEASAGHTPMRAVHRPQLRTVEIKDSIGSELTTPQRLPLKDSNNSSGSSEVVPPATPKIKPALLMTDVSKKVKSRSLASSLTGPRSPKTKLKCRSPVKPVKRLQGSPRSPRSPKSPRSFSTCKSPKRRQNSPGAADSGKPASPIPCHVTDWNI